MKKAIFVVVLMHTIRIIEQFANFEHGQSRRLSPEQVPHSPQGSLAS